MGHLNSIQERDFPTVFKGLSNSDIIEAARQYIMDNNPSYGINEDSTLEDIYYACHKSADGHDKRDSINVRPFCKITDGLPYIVKSIAMDQLSPVE